MQISSGYVSRYFITNGEKKVAELIEPLILLHEKKLSSLMEMLPLLEIVVQSGRPLLIIAEDVEGEMLATLVVNKQRGSLKVAAVRAPGFGDQREEILDDIASLTGGLVVSESLGIRVENITLEMLGEAEKVVVEKDKTTIIGGGKKSEWSKAIPLDVLAPAPAPGTKGQEIALKDWLVSKMRTSPNAPQSKASPCSDWRRWLA